MSGIMQLLLSGRPQVASDPYFEYTTLLLPGNGTNGAQNNTFLDSSTNNFTITRNGNTTQGTFSPFSQTGWGNYFDGATATRLTMPSNTAFAFGTGAYTVEAWVYLSAHAATQTTVVDCGSATGSLNFSILSTGALSLGVFGVGSTLSSAGGAVTLNTWNHVAVVRESTASNATKLYVNGTAVATGTDTGNYSVTTTPAIGGLNSSGFTATGYISNVRLVKGTAVYTSNFTPSTTPLTAITNTSLLTCQSNRFIDNSSNAFTITRNGDVSVQAFSPFNPTAAWSAATNGGSGYFDGSGDYLTTTGTSSFNPSTGNWTFEAWCYFNNASNNDVLINGVGSGFDRFYIIWVGSTFYLGDATSNTIVVSSSKPLNQWFHIAVVKNGSTYTAYLNGASIGTSTTALASSAVTTFEIGARTSQSWFTSGYIANFRYSQSAIYTTTFTPPTSPVTGGALLLNFTNAGIYDATSKNDLETVGNAQISTTQSKFGGSSMYFDGTGDYLTSPANPLCRLMDGNFTVEMWVRLAASQSNVGLVSSFATNNGWIVRLDTTTVVFAYGTGGASTVISNSASLSTGVWYHIAWTKSGTTLRSFVDGTQVGANHTVSSAVDTTNTGLQVGRTHTVTNDLNGFINDLRITKGVARYTTNFAPPTSAFPLL